MNHHFDYPAEANCHICGIVIAEQDYEESKDGTSHLLTGGLTIWKCLKCKKEGRKKPIMEMSDYEIGELELTNMEILLLLPEEISRIKSVLGKI